MENADIMPTATVMLQAETGGASLSMFEDDGNGNLISKNGTTLPAESYSSYTNPASGN